MKNRFTVELNVFYKLKENILGVFQENLNS
jgi:hypothetical protein